MLFHINTLSTLSNISSHHNTQVVAMVLAAGHRIVFRAPYWPIDGPIEFVFNTVEGFLTIFSHLVENNGISLRHWTRTGIANIQTFVPYFNNCGYHIECNYIFKNETIQ